VAANEDEYAAFCPGNCPAKPTKVKDMALRSCYVAVSAAPSTGHRQEGKLVTTKSTIQLTNDGPLTSIHWAKAGLIAGAAAAAAVVLVQLVALQAFPEAGVFEPLRSYPRTVAFVMIPSLLASRLFVWLVQRRPQPVPTFLAISLLVLLLSFIPDFALPLAGKSVLGSSIAAGLHVVAAVIIVPILILLHRRGA